MLNRFSLIMTVVFYAHLLIAVMISEEAKNLIRNNGNKVKKVLIGI